MSTQLTADFWNTNKEEGSHLRDSQEKAVRQQDVILYFFQIHRHGYFTPFDVQYRAKLNNPITSIRRAITNLERAGKLIKTNIMKTGIYGKQNHTWKLA